MATVPLSWWFRHVFTCEVDCKLRSLCAYMGKLSILIQTLPSFHALTRLPAGVFSCLGCWMPVCHIGVSWHGDTLNHPCDFRIFHEMNHQKNYPAIGVLSTYGNSHIPKISKNDLAAEPWHVISQVAVSEVAASAANLRSQITTEDFLNFTVELCCQRLSSKSCSVKGCSVDHQPWGCFGPRNKQ